ncbi:MAG: hypothetical protein R3C03_17070 [Pirellulaceae bacterium]
MHSQFFTRFGLICLCLATVFSIPNFDLASAGDSASLGGPSWPKTFELNYVWGTTDPADLQYGTLAEISMTRNHRIDVLDYGQWYFDVGSWSKSRNSIEFQLDNGVIYSGTKQNDGSYLGVITAPSGLYGIWSGRFQ